MFSERREGFGAISAMITSKCWLLLSYSFCAMYMEKAESGQIVLLTANKFTESCLECKVEFPLLPGPHPPGSGGGGGVPRGGIRRMERVWDSRRFVRSSQKVL